MADSGKTKKILLGIGGGCLGIILLCCLSGFGAYFARQSSIASAAQEQAEQFLTEAQAQDWVAAFETATYDYDYDLHNPDEHRTCVQDTALGDITSFECHDVDVEPLQTDGDVHCTVQSASRGEVEVTINVNSADDMPYLGFYWFSSRDQFGSTWSSDSCASWSGQMFYREPPDGRIRP